MPLLVFRRETLLQSQYTKLAIILLGGLSLEWEAMKQTSHSSLCSWKAMHLLPQSLITSCSAVLSHLKHSSVMNIVLFTSAILFRVPLEIKRALFYNKSAQTPNQTLNRALQVLQQILREKNIVHFQFPWKQQQQTVNLWNSYCYVLRCFLQNCLFVIGVYLIMPVMLDFKAFKA